MEDKERSTQGGNGAGDPCRDVGLPDMDGGALEDEKRGECQPAASAAETRGTETEPGSEGMAGTNRFMSDALA